MQSPIAREKKVLVTALKGDGQFSVFQRLRLVEDDQVVPAFGMVLNRAEHGLDIPGIRESPEVHPAAHAGGDAENILVPDGQKQRSMPAHAVAGGRAMLSVGERVVMAVHILNQFL